MPWTNPPTFTANTVLKAPVMNYAVRDNLFTLGHERPAARLSVAAASQSLFNGTATTINFSNVDWASTGSVATFGFSPLPLTTDRITATIAGIYLVSGTVDFGNNATNTRSVDVYQSSGTNLIGGITDRAVTGFAHTMNFSFVTRSLAVGDYVYIQATQNSGSTLTVGTNTNLSMVLLKAT